MKDGLNIDKYGHNRWYLNGERHRTDGPAIEYKDGSKHWYINDKLHRTDGPAIEYGNGYKSCYINGVNFTEEEYLKRTRKEKLTELGL